MCGEKSVMANTLVEMVRDYGAVICDAQIDDMHFECISKIFPLAKEAREYQAELIAKLILLYVEEEASPAYTYGGAKYDPRLQAIADAIGWRP